jgi:hypothetical protein
MSFSRFSETYRRSEVQLLVTLPGHPEPGNW